MGKGEGWQAWVGACGIGTWGGKKERFLGSCCHPFEGNWERWERGFLECGAVRFLERKSKDLRHVLVITFSLPGCRCWDLLSWGRRASFDPYWRVWLADDGEEEKHFVLSLRKDTGWICPGNVLGSSLPWERGTKKSKVRMCEYVKPMWGAPPKGKPRIAIWSSNSTSGYKPKRTESRGSNTHLHTGVHSSTIHWRQKVETIQVSVNG